MSLKWTRRRRNEDRTKETLVAALQLARREDPGGRLERAVQAELGRYTRAAAADAAAAWARAAGRYVAAWSEGRAGSAGAEDVKKATRELVTLWRRARRSARHVRRYRNRRAAAAAAAAQPLWKRAALDRLGSAMDALSAAYGLKAEGGDPARDAAREGLGREWAHAGPHLAEPGLKGPDGLVASLHKR